MVGQAGNACMTFIFVCAGEAANAYRLHMLSVGSACMLHRLMLEKGEGQFFLCLPLSYQM